MPTPTFEAASVDHNPDGQIANGTSPAVTGANFAIITLHYERDGENDITNPACTFDGNAADYVDWVVTKIGNCWGLVMWKVANPGSGKAIVITWTGVCNNPIAVCRNYKDVEIGNPLGVMAKQTGIGTAISVTVASAEDETVIDMASQNTSGAAVGAGQTQRVNGYVDAVRAMCSDEAGAANVVMSWTTDEARRWATMGVALKPSMSNPAMWFM